MLWFSASVVLVDRLITVNMSQFKRQNLCQGLQLLKFERLTNMVIMQLIYIYICVEDSDCLNVKSRQMW